MIFGECPYCSEPFTIGVPDKTPVFCKYTCEKCDRWFWEYLSRIDPRSYLPEEVEVNEEARSVRLKQEGKTNG
jgi:hypothetical protein